MGILFTIFYQPIANTLFFLMDVVNTNNIVLGILMLVVVIKMLLLPTSVKNSKIQRKLSEISGDLKDIKENIQDKKEQMEKTLEVYKKAEVNPFSPILFLIIQIPFFISTFFVTKDLGSGEFNYQEVLYDFVSQPAFVDFSFLSINTTQQGVISVAILIAASQFILMWYMQKKGGEAQKNTKILSYLLPPIVGLLSLSIVATVGVYWLFNNVVSILQETLIRKQKTEETQSKKQDEESEPPPEPNKE